MEETYEDIVRRWYVKLRGNFTHLLMDKYKDSNMRLSDAENIYQDIFIAIHRNIREGRISANCDWTNYIIRVGLNMASKRYRQIKSENTVDVETPEETDWLIEKSKKIDDTLNQLTTEDDEPTLYNDPEAKALLGDELTHTPEPCASIIRMTYISDMTDAEIAEDLSPYRDNGKPISVNAKAVKARRWLCMQDLMYRVKLALYHAGIIDVKPEKKKRNG